MGNIIVIININYLEIVENNNIKIIKKKRICSRRKVDNIFLN